MIPIRPRSDVVEKRIYRLGNIRNPDNLLSDPAITRPTSGTPPFGLPFAEETPIA
jgi:hypothetical protein